MKNKKNIIDQFLEKHGSKESERYIEHSLEIAEQVYALMAEKGMTQKQLAQAMDKKEAEISRWLSGTHNLTLRSIAKMEVALDAEVITTPRKVEEEFSESGSITITLHARINQIFPKNDEYNEKINIKKNGTKQNLKVVA